MLTDPFPRFCHLPFAKPRLGVSSVESVCLPLCSLWGICRHSADCRSQIGPPLPVPTYIDCIQPFIWLLIEGSVWTLWSWMIVMCPPGQLKLYSGNVSEGRCGSNIHGSMGKYRLDSLRQEQRQSWSEESFNQAIEVSTLSSVQCQITSFLTSARLVTWPSVCLPNVRIWSDQWLVPAKLFWTDCTISEHINF